MSVRINLIITTYAGMYHKFYSKDDTSNKDKKQYLKYNLSLINKTANNLTQITIMKPRINSNHAEIPNYYNFDNIDISNIKDKIKIYECQNIGISYGQFLTAIFKDNDFDYYIFIEDDYFPCIDNFEKKLIDIIDNYDEPLFLCSFIDYKKKYTINSICENNNNLIHKIQTYFNKYNYKNTHIHIPDFSLGILNKKSIINLINTYNNIDNILEIYTFNFKQNHIYQILFGFTLNISNIKIIDYNKFYLNIFFESSNRNLYLCNIVDNYKTWQNNTTQQKKYKLPLFLPIDILYPSDYSRDIKLLYNYVESPDKFSKLLENYNIIKKKDMLNFIDVKNSNKKVCIYINKNHNNYMPFSLYANCVNEILTNFLFTNVTLTNSIQFVKTSKPDILFLFSISLSDVINYFYPTQLKFIINTENYKTWDIEGKLALLNSRYNIHFIEYNILNIKFINENYKNIKTLYIPQLHHSYLNFYYNKHIKDKTNTIKDIDILIYGNNTTERRQNILNILSQNFNIKIVGRVEDNYLCKFINRSKIVLNIFASEDNKPFDYYRNMFLLANNAVLVSEYPRDIDIKFETNLQNLQDFLEISEYDNIINKITYILENYSNNEFIQEIIKKQNIFLEKNNMQEQFLNVFINNI